MTLTSPEATASAGLSRTAQRRRARRLSVGVGLAVVLVVVVIAGLRMGDFPLSTGQVVSALLAQERGGAVFVVRELRLPRLLLGLLVGAALGAAGALFQAVLRNPLASPDIIGITQGASAGAVAAVLLGGVAAGPLVQSAALGGGLAVGLLLYVIAWRGGMAGYRFVLAGIGVAYLAAALIGYVFTRAQVRDAQTALRWLTGSLDQSTWALCAQLGAAVAVLCAVAAAVGPRLQVLLLGDDTASGLGLHTERIRLTVVLTGIALASVATAAAGPVAFVALVAAPTARQLLRDGTPAILTSAAVGAILVAGADLVAQHLLPLAQAVPVGVVTGIIGGPYLIWLLARGRRTEEQR